jgi:broad specificity phosphatase PhoE
MTAALLHLSAALLPAVEVSRAMALSDFSRLGNRYILLRPGETTWEARGLVDSSPINKLAAERGLTKAGRDQVRRAARQLASRGVTSPYVWYDTGSRASQTAEIVAEELGVPRSRQEPEFYFLEARGLGNLDEERIREVLPRVRTMDRADSAATPEPSDDGTPADSIDDVYVRVRQMVSKVENSFSGIDIVVVADSDVLSTIAASACGVDLREHDRFALRAGEFRDLGALQRRDVRRAAVRETSDASDDWRAACADDAVVLAGQGDGDSSVRRSSPPDEPAFSSRTLRDWGYLDETMRTRPGLVLEPLVEPSWTPGSTETK